ncbi:malectin domain-containing carbohydrate-binding protein [Haloarchaeobius sp. DFWS5]|uniref:malectin domain-containing carbohydrate-binding protein n=1 Tax=Haloarchaeobius sp. DFWS5 TaxID=3446114 RepID=UPI003EBB5DB7
MTTELPKQLSTVLVSILLITSTFVGALAVTTTTAVAAEGDDVLYRANAGGPDIAATDSGPDWVSDTPYLVAGGGSTSSHGQPDQLDASVPSSTPSGIWNDERWDPGDGAEMQYEFSVPSGTAVEVRLYFYDGYSGTSAVGDRVFDLSVEDESITDFDPVEEFGDQTGGMQSFTVTSDGTIDVDFGHVTENPQLNAIEIVSTEPQSNVLSGPSSVDFGSVLVGDSETEQVTVTNLGGTGDPPISIDSVGLSGDSTFAVGSAPQSSLAPGESATIPVTYTPSDATPGSATLTISHSGNDSPMTIPLTAEGTSTAEIGFGKSSLQGFGQGSLTALEFGPDGRLYVAKQNGVVYALEIERNDANDYSVVYQKAIDVVQDIPNHDDNGVHNTGETHRQVTGLTVGGTAETPVVYVSSSDPTIKVGDDDDSVDTNSGSISRLTLDWGGDGVLADSEIDHTVMVLGLPRSEENHATNGLDLSDDGTTLFVAQGGHANKGAPSNNFGHTPEYALSAAVLAIDLQQIEQNHQPKSLQDYDSAYPAMDFLYAIPTIQNDDASDGDDLPFGGDDGVNQAKLVENGPVQIWSPGYRNAYDIVLSEDDQLYVIDNGPNTGWGGQPVGEGSGGLCTNAPSESGDYGTGDQLHIAPEGSYGGHPAPIRANPTGADIYDQNGNVVLNITTANSPVPASMVNPVECDYQDPTEDNSIGSTFGWTGGIAEYTASNFGGQMQGDLLVVENANSVERVELNAAGDAVTNQEGNLFSSVSALGIATVGDDGPFPGTVWTARGDLTVFEPNDYDGSGGGPACTAADDSSLDEDGDGYDNADELDVGTNPCSAASTPADFDGDNTSNVNDPDDDNDGLLDTDDPFAIDPDDGTTTSLPATFSFADDSYLGTIVDLGFTGVMTNGADDYQSLYDPEQMTAGGAAEVLTVDAVTTGDAHQSTNSQEYAFQVGVDAPDESFTVHTTVTGYPDTPEDYQSMGVFIGNGDQDNYLKLVTSAKGGSGGVQFAKEVDSAFSDVANPDAPGVTGTTTETDLYLTVHPSNDTVEAFYAVDGGEMTKVGETTIPAGWLDSSDGTGLAIGVISTAFGSDSTFAATWQHLNVEYVEAPPNQPPVADAGTNITVEEGDSVSLNAGASSDPDGDDNALGYTWTQLSGTPDGLLDMSDSAQVSFTAPEVDADSTYTFEVLVDDGDATDTDTVTVTVQDTDDASTGDFVFAVNAGGPEFTASDGTVFVADTNSVGGSTYSTSVDIGETEDDALYQTERYGDPFGYAIPIDNGTYEVTLHFAEIYQGVAGSDSPDSDGPSDGTNQNDRVFNASIEGQEVLTEYDLFADVGPANATTKTFTVEVTDGELTVDFDALYDNAKVSAIEVHAVDDDEPTDPSVFGVETGNATNVATQGADLGGDLTLGEKSSATTYVRFWVQGKPDETYWYTGDSTTESGTFLESVILSPSTTYEWQAMAQSADGDWKAGAVETFTTPTGQFFGATTNDATDVGVEWATLNGEVINFGDNDNATVYFTYWKQGQKESTMVWWTGPVTETTGPFSTDVQLDPNTTYEYVAYAQSNEGEWKAGPMQTFSTDAGAVFGVATEPATDVGGNSATLQGDLTGLGDYDNATTYFTYWKQGEKESTLNWWTGSPQSSTGAFDATVSLDANTTYEYQSFAQSNTGKWTAGSVQSLTTTDEAASAAIELTSPTDGATVVGDSLTVSWDGTSATATDHVHVQLDDEPYQGGQPVDGSYTFENVSPGEHTVTVQVADQSHTVYTNPEATDTVTVTVEAPVEQTGSALVEITPNTGLETSTYGSGSFQMTNTGEKNITSVSFDLSSASLPDMVFDPLGTAGDPTGEGLNIATDGGTGITTAEGDSEAFSEPHNGVDGDDGYDVMTIEFDNFEPGESAAVWADNDPTSIKGATVGSQEAGPVSGLELAGSTVTVTYEDGSTQVTQLAGDGSAGGSTANVTDDEAPAPTLGVAGVTLDGSVLDDRHSAATVADAAQTITVTGQPGETVTLVRVEGELTLKNVPSPYDVEAFEANDAEAVAYYTVTLDENGEGTVPVTLTNTTDDGDGEDAGYNYFTAVHGDPATDAGLASNVVVLQYDENAGSSTETLYRVNAGGSTIASLDDGPDWTGVTGTGSEYLVSVGSSSVGNYCNGDAVSPTASVPSSTPDGVFDCERYGASTWSFPVDSGEEVTVRLYIANQFSGTSGVGDRQFNVSVEGTQVLTQYDPVADVGHANGTMQSFVVTSDGSVDIAFDPGAAENPLVNAIEIVSGDAGDSDGGDSTNSASIAVTPDSGLSTSTYGAGSFQVTNTGDSDITSVTFDLGSAHLPDVVFDPVGTAGDSGAKCLEANSGAATTGYQTPGDNCVEPFSQPHNGVDSDEGYDTATLNFDDFQNGETFTFSVDNDPTSIKDGTQTGSAGSISGLELAGSTITVTYADSTSQTTALFGDGSDGGSQATAKSGLAAAPSIGVDGVSLDAGVLDSRHSGATVSQASQTITVSGTPGETVTVLQVEGQLELGGNAANGYEIEDYEANTAASVTYHTVTLDGNGDGTLGVTLTNSSSNGGYNYFAAAAVDGDGDTGDSSGVIILKFE